jgi:hypothetical protein
LKFLNLKSDTHVEERGESWDAVSYDLWCHVECVFVDCVFGIFEKSLNALMFYLLLNFANDNNVKVRD